jgi:O-methyltransferase involved in polyketide biosynthesis
MSVGPEGDDSARPISAELNQLPKKLMWNLYHRAIAARGAEYRFTDPQAIELVERIDFPFEQFDSDHAAYVAHWHALRARTVDAEIRRFLAVHPAATVVALGEGLETQFSRVDNGALHWITVDQPDIVRLRARFLPDGPRQRSVACSARLPGWMDEVRSADNLLIIAQGLLMYLPLADTDQLITRCARRFPGETMLFDAVPARMVHAQQCRVSTERQHYQPPPFLWGVDAEVRRRFSLLPGVSELREVTPARGRGLLFGVLLPALRRVPGVDELLPGFPVLRAQFALGGGS